MQPMRSTDVVRTALRESSVLVALQLGLLVGVGLLLSACGPPRNRALEAAQQEYVQTRADPAVAQYATTEVAEARVALDRAETALEDGDEENIDHFTHVAEVELEKAREVARAKQAGTQTKVVQKEIERVEDELAALQARVTERGIVLTLSDVFFEVDSANLRPEGMQNLAQLAAFLSAHPDRALAIEGHADSTGTDEYNLRLSERRAASVKTFLASSGVDPSRVFAQGFGERYPVASNDTTQGRSMNRRVEMLVMNPGDPIRVSSVPIVRYNESTTTTTVVR
jgi:OmpA-OmpF porin, OOP family